MDVGIELPGMIRGADGELMLDWARRAEAAGFSTIGMGDRISYPGLEALTSLAACSVVTDRIRLLLNVAVLPLHNAGVFAKQVATIDVFSGGRLTVGVGIGGHPTDYPAAPAPAGDRGARLEEQISFVRKAWSGQPPADGVVNPIGPPPTRDGGPELLLGAFAPAALERVARLADGLVTFSFEPDATKLRADYDAVERAWADHGRSGRPRLVGACYFALGPHAVDGLQTFIRDYYSLLQDVPDAGSATPDAASATTLQDAIAASISTVTPEAIRDAVRAFEEIGTDELIFVPTIAHIDQLERLHDALP